MLLPINSLRTVFTILILIFALQACDSSNSADRIWLGSIITVDDKNQIAEAIAVREGRILAVGTKEVILTLANKNTEVIELGSRAMMPGFIAAHEHPGLSAVFGDMIDLSGFTHKTSDAVWLALKNAVTNTPEGEWIYGMGIDPVLVEDLIMPNRDKLDSIAPNNPVVLVSQSMHSFWVNSMAYDQAGISESISDPENGGHYGRDTSGRLNGFIAEANAADPFLLELKSPLKLFGGLKRSLKKLKNQGFTTVASPGFNAPPWIAKLVAQDWFSPFIRQVVYLREAELKYLPDSPQNGNEYYRIAGIKLWHDGSPYTGTMYLQHPYETHSLTQSLGIHPGQTGTPLVGDDIFYNTMKKFHDLGWQLAIHSQGDASNLLVSNYLANLEGNKTNRRHRVEHGLLISESNLEKLKRLNATPSFHINHILYYGDALAFSLIGPTRAQKVLPVKTAFELELHPTLHADSPMFEASPFSLMTTAITRQTPSGKILGINQAISPQQAIKAMTINGAWQLHMEQQIGSLERNKLADMIIVSANPLTMDISKWNDINIEQVWLGGQQVK